MGMFDTFLDEKIGYSYQAKCFYHPIFSNEKWFDSHTWHSGGRLYDFNIGDELPLETMYYHYPQNFCIINEDDEYQVIEIRDGKFNGFIESINDIHDLHDSFYTYNGTKIKAFDKQKVLDYVSASKGEMGKEQEQRNFLDFYKIWHEESTIEQKLGELFECFQFAQKTIGHEFMGSGGMVDVVAMTPIIEEYKTNHPNEFKTFIKKHNIMWGE